MAILFLDSPTSREGAFKWSGFSGVAVLTGTPYGGDYYRYQANNTHFTNYTITPAASSVVFSFLSRFTAAQDGNLNNHTIEVFGDGGGTEHMTFGVSGSGQVTCRRGGGNGTLIVASDPSVIVINDWHHWEIRCVVHDTTGIVQVWIDGVQVINATNVDTKNGGTNNTIDKVEFFRTAAGEHHAADFVITNGTTPLGVTRVHPLLPDADGNYTAFTPSTGTSHFALVDEQTPNGDTDYNSATTEGDKDSYTFPSLPTGTWDILAVQTALNARRFDPGTKFLRPFIRISATDYVGTSHVLSESYGAKLDLWETNPATASAWTQAEVDAIEVGAEVRDS